MSPSRRIFLNVVATYGRSLYALAIGLFCGRWTLMALGQVDYGLVSVVGGLTAFLYFVNELMAFSVARFYAFSVGQARTAADASAGVEECRRWFSIAVGIHTVLPALLVIVGYPIGAWAVGHFLVIPPDRVHACLWVWRLTCLSAFVAMVNVPFAAMYNAKQEIAELTVYSFATTTLNVCFMYYLVTHPGVWLVTYAAWTCLLSVVPQLMILVRAVFKYPECRFRLVYLLDRPRILQVVRLAGCRFIGAFSTLVSGQGLVLVVNKYLGPARNAAMAIGQTIAAQSSALSGAMSGAFSPAIVSGAGAGDLEGMRAMIFRSCRFSVAAILVFAIPLMLEIKYVTVLWLKTPPEGTAVIAVFLLIDLILARLSEGHFLGLMALDRIFSFQVCESIFFFLRLALGWMLVLIGWDLWAIGVAYVSTGIFSVLLKLVWGRRICGLSIAYWFRHVFLPLAVAAGSALGIGSVCLLLAPSFPRLALTTLACEAVLLPQFWFFVFTRDERRIVVGKLRSFL